MSCRRIVSAVGLVMALLVAGCAQPPKDVVAPIPATLGGGIVVGVSSTQNADPYQAGKAAAEALRASMGAAPIRAVVVSECFEDAKRKSRALAGVCSVLPKQVVFGGATYGSFTQGGCAVQDSVALLGLGGAGISVSAALQRDLGTARLVYDEHKAEIERLLRAAGKELASKLPRGSADRLAILIADAHSPKNASLVEGVQEVLGATFPITGGCVNKNAGQTFVYFQGRMYQDSALLLLLAGEFDVAMSGRKAKENEQVIATARDAAAEALANAKGKPFAGLAFDCAGRKGKLKNVGDELAAIQSAIGKSLPLFGCYCAGEIGPADVSEAKSGVLSSGVGWHVMMTVLSEKR